MECKDSISDFLGFSPIIGGAPISEDSCVFIKTFCLDKKIKKAIELGTGAGNVTKTLYHSGLDKIYSIDQNKKFSDQVKKEMDSDKIVFCHREVKVRGEGYIFGDEISQKYDLVVIDGPFVDPEGRMRSAMKINAKHYIFDDSYRDRKYIDMFINNRNDIDSFEEIKTERGLAVISIKDNMIKRRGRK